MGFPTEEQPSEQKQLCNHWKDKFVITTLCFRDIQHQKYRSNINTQFSNNNNIKIVIKR